MLPYFPVAYPDELFYSRCARYAEWAGYRVGRAPLRDLFGKSYQTVGIGFPRHLDTFIAVLPPAYHEDHTQLINKGSLLPFYAPFLTSTRVEQLRQFMRNETSPVRSSGVLGWPGNKSIRPLHLRLCLACAEQDQARYGESYWHRTHQMPGVLWCPLHELLLHRSTTFGVDRLTTARQARTARMVPVEALQPQEHKPLVQFTKDAAWVLQNIDLPSDPDAMQKRYASLLADRNLASHSGQIREKAFLQAIGEFYPASLLSRFGCPTMLAQRRSPFIKLARPFRHAQHPAYHLLLMQFLRQEAAGFWDLPAQPGPFGASPWPCLNPAAQHYQEAVVHTCQIQPSRKDGRPIGTFRCHCGFHYQRIGPDYGPLDRYRCTKIISEQADSQLREQESRLDAARSAWLRAVQQSADPKQASARSCSPKIYRWLHQYDRAWLTLHRPAYRMRIIRRSRIDWHHRDSVMYEALGQAVERLLHWPGRPERLTSKRLIREAQQHVQIRVDLAHMPQCASLLEKFREDHDAFVRRRMDWAAAEFYKEQQIPTRSAFVTRMGLGCWVYSRPHVMDRITKIIQGLSQFT